MNQWPWIAGAVATIALVGGIAWFDQQSNKPPSTTVPAEVAAVRPDDWAEGPAEAPVTLIEYADFQCPACRAYAPIVDELLKQRPDMVRFVYRYLPLTTIHKNALPSAYAAEAAGRQGQFFELLHALFDHQDEWKDLSNAKAKDAFAGYASDLKIDMDRFDADRESQAVKDRIGDSAAESARLGFESTPTFVLNGEHIDSPRSAEEFIAVVDAAKAKLDAAKTSEQGTGAPGAATQ